MQNVAAAVAGAAIAVYGLRRRASSTFGLAIIVIAAVLLLATLIAGGVQGVHRWLRIGPLTLHAASLVIPLVLVELDRLLHHARLAIAFGIMLAVAAILAIQPDAGQATAFAGSGVLLLAAHWKRNRPAVAGMLALLITLAGLSFLRSDPLAPVPHVEEIALRIAQKGAVWAIAVVIALALLIVPFVTRTAAGLAVAVYLALTIAASYWGHFPVSVLGYGMSPIIGYFAGWTWLRARVSPQ
jgi:cell division protein FtsW (lipid II flippase)